MQNLLNQIRDIVRNSFDRFLCALPVIGDALQLVRILYQLAQDAKTQREHLLVHICEIGSEVTTNAARAEQIQQDRIKDSQVLRAQLNRIGTFNLASIVQNIREELHERVDALQHSTTESFDVVLDLHTFLRDRVEELKPLVPDMTVEEMQTDHEIWKRNCCPQPTN